MACAGKVRVREPAPDFTCEAVVCGNFEELSLEYYMSKDQWLMLLFIPMAFSFVCPTEVIAFSDSIDEFTARQCAVAFISTDSKYGLWTWQNRPRKEGGLGNIRVPLLSDQSHRISRDYGVLLEDRGISLRGMFLINPQGIVKQTTINDFSVGRSVTESLRLLEAFQTTEKYGVVCPSNWHPGKDTIDPTIEGRQSYLDKTYRDLTSTPSSPRGDNPSSPMRESRPNSVVNPLGSRPASAINPHDSPALAPRQSPPHSPMEAAFARLGLRNSASSNSSPLASPLEGVFGHKKTLSGLSRTSYFD